jgi:hypothetical protein
MNTFQFDECFDDFDVIEACNNEKKAEALRLDDELMGKLDPQVLAVLMVRPIPLVTIDGKLPGKHTAHIPEINPGIITVGYSRYTIDRRREALKTLTTTAAGQILHKFKDLCPNWHTLIVRNSIVEITNKEVIVSHVEKGMLKFDIHILFEEDAKQLETKLTAVLLANAQRNALPLAGRS